MGSKFRIAIIAAGLMWYSAAKAEQVRCRIDWPGYILAYDGPFIQLPVFTDHMDPKVKDASVFYKFFSNEYCGVRQVEKFENGRLIWTDTYSPDHGEKCENMTGERRFINGDRRSIRLGENCKLKE